MLHKNNERVGAAGLSVPIGCSPRYGSSTTCISFMKEDGCYILKIYIKKNRKKEVGQKHQDEEENGHSFCLVQLNGILSQCIISSCLECRRLLQRKRPLNQSFRCLFLELILVG